LDGGGSTTLYVKDAPDNGIVNHPSDNKKFDRQGERFVVNSLLFIPR
ncbi:MAG: phosphodiester glycosidase family protein, partial [Bacteroidales bacterium]|nr:phosphodiester glycosidase family protein [Bacteroidales bacterium]